LREHWPSLTVLAPDDARIDTATARVGDGEHVSLNGSDFSVIAVPGHTLTHIAFHRPDGAHGGQLFCGDTLFSLGCGRLFEGTPTQMLASLDKLAALPADTQVCCAHEYTKSNAAFARVVEPGNAALLQRLEEVDAMRRNERPSLPSTLASELACNPFLRVDVPAVHAAVAAHIGRDPTDRIETFAELRRWKDNFRA
jgi:hydroxyacylglutathione hydrolase